ncbi:hypothetical protein BX666DRAFT_2021941 [Dichotomocladium elegans]|nr:hypothetical protein BX666DRAFT_2021941 [Dichotomocladium elegans]
MTPVESFSHWAKENKIQAMQVAIGKTEFAGYGLFATADIVDGAAVAIPSNVHLTAARAKQMHPELELLEDQDDKTLLRLLLAFEKHRPTPAWAPYLAILPNTADSLFEYESALEGTSLARSIHAKRTALTNEWRQFHACFPWLTLDMWTWADMVVRSRAVGLDGDGGWVLLPFFDFVNHSLTPNTRWVPQQDGSVAIIVTQPIKAGEELTFSYGQKSNQELLFSYGFTIHGNPEPPRIVLPAFGFMDMDDMESQLKMTWLAQVKPVLALERGEWTKESFRLMYLVVLDQDDGLNFALDDREHVQLSLYDYHVKSLEDLEKRLAQTDKFPIIRLRAVVLLLNATTSLFETIRAKDTLKSHQTAGLKEHIERYRSDEEYLLHAAMEELIKLQNELMNDNTVLDYLEAQQESH